jgi:hypothetical protein
MKRTTLPQSIRDALAEHLDDPDFCAEMASRYLNADEATQADIEAFHESGGPAMIEDAERRRVP